jgi:hypothetical protein
MAIRFREDQLEAICDEAKVLIETAEWLKANTRTKKSERAEIDRMVRQALLVFDFGLLNAYALPGIDDADVRTHFASALDLSKLPKRKKQSPNRVSPVGFGEELLLDDQGGPADFEGIELQDMGARDSVNLPGLVPDDEDEDEGSEEDERRPLLMDGQAGAEGEVDNEGADELEGSAAMDPEVRRPIPNDYFDFVKALRSVVELQLAAVETFESAASASPTLGNELREAIFSDEDLSPALEDYYAMLPDELVVVPYGLSRLSRALAAPYDPSDDLQVELEQFNRYLFGDEAAVLPGSEAFGRLEEEATNFLGIDDSRILSSWDLLNQVNAKLENNGQSIEEDVNAAMAKVITEIKKKFNRIKAQHPDRKSLQDVEARMLDIQTHLESLRPAFVEQLKATFRAHQRKFYREPAAGEAAVEAAPHEPAGLIQLNRVELIEEFAPANTFFNDQNTGLLQRLTYDDPFITDIRSLIALLDSEVEPQDIVPDYENEAQVAAHREKIVTADKLLVGFVNLVFAHKMHGRALGILEKLKQEQSGHYAGRYEMVFTELAELANTQNALTPGAMNCKAMLFDSEVNAFSVLAALLENHLDQSRPLQPELSELDPGLARLRLTVNDRWHVPVAIAEGAVPRDRLELIKAGIGGFSGFLEISYPDIDALDNMFDAANIIGHNQERILSSWGHLATIEAMLANGGREINENVDAMMSRVADDICNAYCAAHPRATDLDDREADIRAYVEGTLGAHYKVALTNLYEAQKAKFYPAVGDDEYSHRELIRLYAGRASFFAEAPLAPLGEPPLLSFIESLDAIDPTGEPAIGSMQELLHLLDGNADEQIEYSNLDAIDGQKVKRDKAKVLLETFVNKVFRVGSEQRAAALRIVNDAFQNQMLFSDGQYSSIRDDLLALAIDDALVEGASECRAALFGESESVDKSESVLGALLHHHQVSAKPLRDYDRLENIRLRLNAIDGYRYDSIPDLFDAPSDAPEVLLAPPDLLLEDIKAHTDNAKAATKLLQAMFGNDAFGDVGKELCARLDAVFEYYSIVGDEDARDRNIHADMSDPDAVINAAHLALGKCRARTQGAEGGRGYIQLFEGFLEALRDTDGAQNNEARTNQLKRALFKLLEGLSDGDEFEIKPEMEARFNRFFAENESVISQLLTVYKNHLRAMIQAQASFTLRVDATSELAAFVVVERPGCWLRLAAGNGTLGVRKRDPYFLSHGRRSCKPDLSQTREDLARDARLFASENVDVLSDRTAGATRRTVFDPFGRLNAVSHEYASTRNQMFRFLRGINISEGRVDEWLKRYDDLKQKMNVLLSPAARSAVIAVPEERRLALCKSLLTDAELGGLENTYKYLYKENLRNLDDKRNLRNLGADALLREILRLHPDFKDTKLSVLVGGLGLHADIQNQTIEEFLDAPDLEFDFTQRNAVLEQCREKLIEDVIPNDLVTKTWGDLRTAEARQLATARLKLASELRDVEESLDNSLRSRKGSDPSFEDLNASFKGLQGEMALVVNGRQRMLLTPNEPVVEAPGMFDVQAAFIAEAAPSRQNALFHGHDLTKSLLKSAKLRYSNNALTADYPYAFSPSKWDKLERQSKTMLEFFNKIKTMLPTGPNLNVLSKDVDDFLSEIKSLKQGGSGSNMQRNGDLIRFRQKVYRINRALDKLRGSFASVMMQDHLRDHVQRVYHSSSDAAQAFVENQVKPIFETSIHNLRTCVNNYSDAHTNKVTGAYTQREESKESRATSIMANKKRYGSPVEGERVTSTMWRRSLGIKPEYRSSSARAVDAPGR